MGRRSFGHLRGQHRKIVDAWRISVLLLLVYTSLFCSLPAGWMAVYASLFCSWSFLFFYLYYDGSQNVKTQNMVVVVVVYFAFTIIALAEGAAQAGEPMCN